MPACLPIIDGCTSISFYLIYNMVFQVSVENIFEGERYDRTFRIMNITCKFLLFACNILCKTASVL